MASTLWQNLQSAWSAVWPFAGSLKNDEPLLADEKAMREALAFVDPSRLFGGKLSLPYNPSVLATRKGLNIFDQMKLDEQVKAALAFKKHAVLAAGWEVASPGDQDEKWEVTAFVRSVFKAVPGGMTQFIRSLLLGIDYGYSITEKVYADGTGELEGRLTLGRVISAKPHYFDFAADAHGQVLALLQKYVPGRTAPGQLLEFPPDKFVVYTHDKEFENAYGRSDLEAAYRCYSDDTQTLTGDGWKFLSDVTLDDDVATLDDDGVMTYKKPVNRYEYDYIGELISERSKAVDLMVTPNHMMWVQTERDYQAGRGFRFMEAKDMPRHVRYKRDAKWVGEERTEMIFPALEYQQEIITRDGRKSVTKTIPERRIPMDEWLWLFGVWIAEGSLTRERYGIGITQKPGDTQDEILQRVRACGLTAHKSGKTVEFVSKQICQYLDQFGGSWKKFIPKDTKVLSSRQLSILMDGLMFGDGRGDVAYCTVSKRLADDVQEILLKMGFASSVRIENAVAAEVGTARFSTNSIFIVGWHRKSVGSTKANVHSHRRQRVSYSGKVYCLEVPHHRLYVRRNGKACWCGNSWWIKDNSYKWFAVSLERYGMPPLFMLYNPNTYQDPQVGELKKIVKNIQNATLGLIPRGKKDDLEFWSAELGGRAKDVFLAALSRFDADIAKALLQPSLTGFSGEGQGTESRGSLARANVRWKAFLFVVEGLQVRVATTINEQLVRQLCDLNFPNLKTYPQFKFSRLDDEAQLDLFKTWTVMVEGKVVNRIPDDEAHIRTSLGFPDNDNPVIEALPAKGTTVPIPGAPDVKVMAQEELSEEMRAFAEENGGEWREVGGQLMCVATEAAWRGDREHKSSASDLKFVELIDGITRMADRPLPPAPIVHVAAPTVNVAPAQVNFSEGSIATEVHPASVNVTVEKGGATSTTVTGRDKDGRIVSTVTKELPK